MLVLKLVVVPVLIAAVTLATRRWGPRVGGLLMAMPLVAGPTLAIYAVEHGHAFAADAAEATLLGLVAVAAFCVSYARSAARCNWAVSLLGGWLSFALIATLLHRLEFGPSATLVFGIAALMAARWAIPREPSSNILTSRPSWDLPMRMVTAALLVFVLTSLAARLGPTVSGMLTPFPVAIAILAAFTHAQSGTAAVRQFLREFIPGLCTFAAFCFVLAPALRTVGLLAAFAAALVVQFTLQAIVLLAGAIATQRFTWSGLAEQPRGRRAFYWPNSSTSRSSRT